MKQYTRPAYGDSLQERWPVVTVQATIQSFKSELQPIATMHSCVILAEHMLSHELQRDFTFGFAAWWNFQGHMTTKRSACASLHLLSATLQTPYGFCTGRCTIRLIFSGSIAKQPVGLMQVLMKQVPQNFDLTYAARLHFLQ
eukprot:gnl/TRDRNA2_/TRDRNA2_164437_c1_seq1.p2 gnl/TRDRNA2_/TRDRNA2_164437_c1~~gnl/TRDRNA2_/TRDRNA2_164437_c1_seq1.p2  ORF type:complete len:142 (-),score=13.88 gnl/TRDRNA2_/TRDRNA2_164437_c1_seq1:430-855(-)